MSEIKSYAQSGYFHMRNLSYQRLNWTDEYFPHVVNERISFLTG